MNLVIGSDSNRWDTIKVSPIDSALLFGHHSLEVCELKEAVMEVVEVQNAHQQEGSGNENPGEKHGKAKLLQAEVIQAREKKQRNRGT